MKRIDAHRHLYAAAGGLFGRRQELRSTYLRCLTRLARIRFHQEQGLNEQGIQLLDRAIFAVYCECRDAGAAEEALAVLEQVRRDAALQQAA